MKMYKSLKEMPNHNIGDILIEKDGHYAWSELPFYHFEIGHIESNPEWFELIVDDWENDEIFYYISTDFEVVEKEFNPLQHHRLVLNGNAFKEKSTADWVKKNINKLLNDDDYIITNNNTIQKILANIKANKIDKSIELLSDLL